MGITIATSLYAAKPSRTAEKNKKTMAQWRSRFRPGSGGFVMHPAAGDPAIARALAKQPVCQQEFEANRLFFRTARVSPDRFFKSNNKIAGRMINMTTMMYNNLPAFS
jgi:hypothetical protein